MIFGSERFPVDAEFARRITGSYGEQGSRWLGELPEIAGELETEWELTLQEPIADLSYSYVIPGNNSSGQQVMLKCAVPGAAFDSEIAALRCYTKEIVVEVYAVDMVRGGVLLERLVPGAPLSIIESDAEATRVAAELMSDLYSQPPAGQQFPGVADWMQALFDRTVDDFPALLSRETVVEAQRCGRARLEEMQDEVVLHGDLHHMNILSATRRSWIVIDPKGVRGEPEYEVGAFLRNPLPEIGECVDLVALLSSRLDIFHQVLGYDRQRMREWALAQAVLSIVWSLNGDESGWKPVARVAEALRKLGNT